MPLTKINEKMILKPKMCRELIAEIAFQYKGRIPHIRYDKAAKIAPLPREGVPNEGLFMAYLYFKKNSVVRGRLVGNA